MWSLRWVQLERLLLEGAFGLRLQGLIMPSFYRANCCEASYLHSSNIR